MRSKLTLTALVATTILVTGCDDILSKNDNHTGSVLAKVNGQKIRQSEVDSHFADIPAEATAGKEEALKRQVLERLVEQAIIGQETKELGLDETAEYKKQKKLLLGQLQYQTLLAHKLKEAVTDEAIAAHYEKTKAQRAYPAVRASHILVKTEAEAKKLARKATPKNFAELAKKHSLGPTKTQGGDLGWFSKQAMVPAFADVAFDTKPNTVAKKPVQTQFGWHVVFVAGKNDNFIPPLTPQVKQDLQAELNQQVAAAYLKELLASAKVTYTKDAPVLETAEEADEAASEQN